MYFEYSIIIFLNLSLLSFCFNNQSLTLKNEISKRNNRRPYDAKTKLLRYLFTNYNPNMIPIQNHKYSQKVYIGLAMIQLINMYEREQIMKSSFWIHLLWKDNELKWNHIKEFNYINKIHVPFNRIWTPNVILFNDADGIYESNYRSNVKIKSTGELKWILPGIFNSTCQLDLKYYPFDEQLCELRFGLLGYTNDEIKLDYYEGYKHVFLDEYIVSGQWDLIEVPAKIEYINDTFNKTIAQMVYSFKIKRKTLYYTINLIIPIFLIACLSICVFYLPTESQEKINLSLSILCSMVFYFLLLVKQLPQNGIVIPLISKYILFTFILNFISVLVTCVIINNYYKDSNIHKMTKWVQTILNNYLTKLVCLSPPKSKITHKQQHKNVSALRGIFTNSKLYRIDRLKNKINSSLVRRTKSAEFYHTRRDAILHSSRSIEYISNTLITERLNEKTKQYWKHLSAILDRIMLILFIIVTLLITYEILFKSSGFFDAYLDQNRVLNENSKYKRLK